MNGRYVAGAVAGALAAGAGLSVLLMAGEKKSGTPSELADLARAGVARAGGTPPPAAALPSAGEQALVQAGHLALSALAGLAYAAATDEDTSPLPAGAAFGLAFYVAAHWVTGPALGLKSPEWRSDPATIGMHTANHLLFGLATAFAAHAAAHRPN